MKDYYRDYCMGCGLCKSICESEMTETKEGFLSVKESKDHVEFYSRICPVQGRQCDSMSRKSIWGKSREVFLSYATDEKIRKESSSGGVLTALCIYLLETGLVDGIIQTRENPYDPIDTMIVCSRNRDDVIKCSGSRYSSSMPLENIDEYLQKDERYCFVGKPCDVIALKNYLSIETGVKAGFLYFFSFFCAGVPSKDANMALLDKLGLCHSECASLRYRGNGWPGHTIASDRNGRIYELDYKTAWSETLGRDIRKICRFCIDGIGEAADIACGDAWYVQGDGKPSFEEKDGRNVVFCRTENGANVFNEACKAGELSKKEYPGYDEELRHTQAYQFYRRATLGSMIFAMKITGKKYPRYAKDLLRTYSKETTFKYKLVYFCGTLKRIIKKKI